MPPGARSLSRDRSVTAHKLKPGTIRRIAGFAKPYRLAIGLFLGLVIVDAIAGAATPLIYRAIIDQGIQEERTGLVVGLAILVAVLAILSGALGLVQRWFSARIGEGLIHDLRTQVFDHVQRMPIGFFSRAQTGALVSRLNSDVQGAQQAFTSTLSSVVGNVVTVVTTLAAMFVLSWQITLLALALLPLFVLPARWVGTRLADITREKYRLNGEMGQMMTERFNVSGALLVKLFGRPETESDQFSARAGRVRDIGVTSAMYSRVVMTALGLLASLAAALVYGVGGTMAIAGSLGIGTLVALTSYLNRLYGPLTSLSNVQVDVMTTLVSFERVFEVLDLEPTIVDAPDATPLPAGPVGVELDGVRFHYPSASEVSLASLEGVARLDDTASTDVLHDISLSVAPGKMLALVGPSGAGKSTIAGLVSRLYDPSDGVVRIGGHDVLLARTGYTGEDGFEVYSEAPHAADVWQTLTEAGEGHGLLPAGLACRDTLRLEAGMPLYGNELTADMTPFDAGLGRVVKFDKAADFVGRAALERRRDAGDAVEQVLVGLIAEGRRAARHGYPVMNGDDQVGTVTSGALSPTLGHPIAMAYVPPTLTDPGTALTVDIRGKAMPVSVVKLPFYKRA